MYFHELKTFIYLAFYLVFLYQFYCDQWVEGGKNHYIQFIKILYLQTTSQCQISYFRLDKGSNSILRGGR